MSVIESLPVVRGRYQENVDLSRLTWFRVGGLADVVFKPADPQDLSCFLQNCPQDIPLHTMGVGSNTLVRDGGVRGVILRLGSAFSQIAFEGNTIYVGAGLLDRTLALMAADEGISGLEFLAGIPGTVGGALRMNAGCYGSEIKDILKWVQVMDRDGNIHKLNADELKMTYRHIDLPKDWVFVGAAFEGTPGKPEEIHARIEGLLSTREDAQPVNSRTGGSTFANPEGMKCWELIDQAGCRGMTHGGAQVSEKHCNFLINTGDATAHDLEQLAESVREKVKNTSGVDLKWEIERVGEALQNSEVHCAN